MPNRLAKETSPYLLQHADNPVDWYPWGDEALAQARADDKPIFLSIGYSACHWCHVMAHESFEDRETAALMNRHFVNVKVDREERPDLDQIYMSAVQAMTGSGGWPMSVFLTPAGVPFYGGTYFPPRPRYGMPSFQDVLRAVAEAWQDRRSELERSGARLVENIARPGALLEAAGDALFLQDTLETALENLGQQFDRTHAGWGGAPKFPQPMALELLLRLHNTTGDQEPLAMATQTLEAMARGGMYDQLGGGFHRYSVDERWLVPHFEKMLYDNAQLARVYLHAWQATGEPFFRTITEEILDYVVREMTDPAGGFYSTQDADSEDEEGKFFVWTPAEIRAILGGEAEVFMAAHAVTKPGNFEGRNILEYVGVLDDRPAWADARRKLFEARRGRVHPGRDEKVLTSWNGLMLAAFAEAARVFGRADYRQIAERNAGFVLRELRSDGWRLLHSWKDGRARFNGYLEDYAFFVEGLLALYQTTFEPRWYQAARDLAETMVARFSAPDGGFFDTSDDHEQLVTRPRDLQDNATPSGNGMAATVLLKLAGLAAEPRFAELAEAALAPLQQLMARFPLGFAQWLQALNYALERPREIAIVGDLDAPDTQALLAVARDGYRPHQVVAAGGPEAGVPLLAGRSALDGRPAAYVCRDSACLVPVTQPEELKALLK